MGALLRRKELLYFCRDYTGQHSLSHAPWSSYSVEDGIEIASLLSAESSSWSSADALCAVNVLAVNIRTFPCGCCECAASIQHHGVCRNRYRGRVCSFGWRHCVAITEERSSQHLYPLAGDRFERRLVCRHARRRRFPLQRWRGELAHHSADNALDDTHARCARRLHTCRHFRWRCVQSTDAGATWFAAHAGLADPTCVR